MLSITDLKTGTYLTLDGEPYVVVSYEHSKQARQGGIMRTTLKNLVTNATINKTFKGNDKIQECDIHYSKAQYLYKDEDNYYFMDTENYSQFTLNKKIIDDKSYFLQENSEVKIQNFNDTPINIQIPVKVNLKVADTKPGVKGDTATTATKPATLETGLEIQVPLFIDENDIVTIDTRTGKYIERYKK